MKAVFEVLRPGLLDTVQDLGRPGWQRFGMVTGGAMDAFALQVGNLLAGNARGAAALEMALRGPVLKALDESLVCLAGADLNATLDGEPLAAWKCCAVRAGQELAFGESRAGVWTYLCVAGSLAVPMVLGSASTFLRARLGGLSGRALAAGDILKIHATKAPTSAFIGRGLSPGEVPGWAKDARVRVVMGPQDDAFGREALETFLREGYRVSAQSDRMGYRLQGPPLISSLRGEMITDAAAPGSIQVPPGGQPIVLMADCQTSGGYPKIATVISVDLGVVAQVPPGGTLRFESVPIEAAQDLAEERERYLKRMQAGCGVY